jgi:signal transduction histidine kinase
LRLRAEFVEDEETRVKIVETLDEMQQMAEATLAFARGEAAPEETRLVDLGGLVSAVCADLAATGSDVACDDFRGLTARCRPVALKRAFRNVIENAVAYGKRARVSIARRDEAIAVAVDDDGPGIPNSELEKVFKPFVRLEGSRNRETGGAGLGLAIARSIVRGHGGEIALENRPEGGLRATLLLPVAAPLEAAARSEKNARKLLPFRRDEAAQAVRSIGL